jgi:hypothetical protein
MESILLAIAFAVLVSGLWWPSDFEDGKTLCVLLF